MKESEARKQLTDQQRRILDYLREYIAAKGFPPTVREIGEGVGLASTSTVHGHLQRLAEKGYIRRDPAKPRTIEIVGEGVPERAVWYVPVVGRVAAGPLTYAELDIEEHIPLSPDFVRADPSELFFLRVRGDSMILAGIHDGDLLLVRRQAHARDGEIIVAMVEGEATVKRIYRERGRIRLQPENPYMDPIYVTDMKVVGKVAAVVRRMA